NGAFVRHIRRSRHEYGLRLEAFLDSATKFDLPLQFPFTDGGMNLAGFLSSSVCDAEFSERLKKRGLDTPPSRDIHYGPLHRAYCSDLQLLNRRSFANLFSLLLRF